MKCDIKHTIKKYGFLPGLGLLSFCLGIIVTETNLTGVIVDVGDKMQQLSEGKWCVFAKTGGKETLEETEELLVGDTVIQEFNFSEEILKHDIICIRVYVNNYQRGDIGTLQVKVKQDNMLFKRKIDSSDIKENAYFEFLLETEGFQQGSAKLICTSADGSEGHTLSLYLTDDLVYSEAMQVGNERLFRNLKMEIYLPF